MKSKQLKTIHPLLVGMLAVSFFALLPTAHVSAAKADDRATEYCKKYTDAQQKEVCEFGYKKGYSKSTTGDCFNKVADELPGRQTSAQVTNHNLYKVVCKPAKIQGMQDRDADDSGNTNQTYGDKKCGSVSTFFDFSCGSVDNKSGDENNPIFSILLTIVAWLTAGVMVAVIGGIVYGGYLYMTAQDNASQTQKGIKIIVDAVIGLIAFGLMWTILNFIIPGGIYAG